MKKKKMDKFTTCCYTFMCLCLAVEIIGGLMMFDRLNIYSIICVAASNMVFTSYQEKYILPFFTNDKKGDF